MAERLPLQRLHLLLLKPQIRRVDEALEDRRAVHSYALRAGLGFSGRLYVAHPSQAPPQWLSFVQTGLTESLEELTNRTNAAVLLIRRRGRIFALPFGYGRHLVRLSTVVPDFGLKAALNGLRPDSLRSVDSFTVEEQTVHVRAQSSRAAGSHLFAQARVSAEALLGDDTYRAEVRQILRSLDPAWEERIPIARPSPASVHIVLAILGTRDCNPGNELPFFSQLTLSRTAEALQSRGLRVSLLGVRVQETPGPQSRGRKSR